MSYFIKETHRKGDLYYQIYEGHYDKEKGYSVQTSYKVLGYLSDLKSKGIDNPKEYYKEEVNKLLDKSNKLITKANQEKIDLMFSHINSTPRESLGDKTPYDIFTFIYGKDLADKLNIQKIEKDEVCMK